MLHLLLSAALLAQAPASQPPESGLVPCRPRATQTEERIYDRYMRRFETLGITPQEQAQIQSLVHQYSLAHPAGSPFDQFANRELREEILGVLTPQQRETLQQLNAQRRAEMPAHPRCQK